MLSKKLEAQLQKIQSSIQKAYGKESISYLGSNESLEMPRFSSTCRTLDRALGGGFPEGRIIELFGPPSSGKCHGKGTKILMYDGTTSLVEDIKVGDKVMGSDSTPRTVLKLARGRDMMYRITPDDERDSFIVNSEHVLSLVNNESEKPIYKNITVKDYLEQGNRFKRTNVLYRVPVDFHEYEKENLTVEPYFAGLWLGDENRDKIGICTFNKEVISYLENYVKRLGMGLVCCTGKNRQGYDVIEFGSVNDFTEAKMMLKSEGGIPFSYKVSSRKNRLGLLAGLIDYGCTIDDNVVSFEYESEKLIDDIIFVSRSLGFSCEKITKISSRWGSEKLTDEGEVKTTYIAVIKGCFNDLPLLVESNKLALAESFLSESSVDFDIKEIGEDDYYGFSLDKDHLYLLDNFIVNHNSTTCLHAISSIQLKYPDVPVAYLDSEFSFDPEYAQRLGVNVGALLVSQPETGNLTFDIMISLIEEGVKLIVVDSVASLLPKEEDEASMNDNQMGVQARLMSKGLRKLSTYAGKAKCTIIFTNQTRKKIGVMYGDPTCVTPDTMVEVMID